jgi:hypothetical protein
MALREISLHLPNRPGTLAGVARLLAQDHINVAAISVDSQSRTGHVRLIVSDPGSATRLLRKAGYRPQVREVLAVRLEDRTGAFLSVLNILGRAGVNIRSVVILVAREGTEPIVALSTDNVPRARRLLRDAGYGTSLDELKVSNRQLIANAPTIPLESVATHL